MLADKLKSVVVSSTSSRGLFAGDSPWSSPGNFTVIDYIEISTPGNATDFGDLTVGRGFLTGTDNGTSDRGLIAGGSKMTTYPTTVFMNTIDYVTISSPGNATDFGDLWDGLYGPGGCSNGPNDRGVFGGGNGQPSTQGQNTIGYVTISTTSNTTDFGDLTTKGYAIDGCSNGSNERGVFWGRQGHLSGAPGPSAIDYITISSTGNATDFGDPTGARTAYGATSNGTSDRGVNCGGDNAGAKNTIDYITISSTGNATDFGDLTAASSWVAATSNGTGDVAVVGAIDSGGVNNSGIDYFTISTTGNASDFGDLSAAREGPTAVSNGLT